MAYRFGRCFCWYPSDKERKMKIDSETVKSALYIGGAIAVVYTVVSISRKMKETGDDFAAAAQRVINDARAAAAAIPEYITQKGQEIGTEVNNTIQTAKKFVGAESTVTSSNPDFVAPTYVREVPKAQWPAAVKNFVKLQAKARGEYKTGLFGFDYSGWHYYTDGTIMTDSGDYWQINNIGAGMETAEGFSVTGIYAGADSPWQVNSYDIALRTRQDFDALMKNPNISALAEKE